MIIKSPVDRNCAARNKIEVELVVLLVQLVKTISFLKAFVILQRCSRVGQVSLVGLLSTELLNRTGNKGGLRPCLASADCDCILRPRIATVDACLAPACVGPRVASADRATCCLLSRVLRPRVAPAAGIARRVRIQVITPPTMDGIIFDIIVIIGE